MPLLPPQNLNGGASLLIIKVRLGDDVRKFPIHNRDITYNELLLMMQRIFKGRISSTDHVVLKYNDEEGDMISIGDDSDLAFAIQTERSLKLVLFVNDEPRLLEADDLTRVRVELIKIRDVSNKLLDSFEPTRHANSSVQQNDLKQESPPKEAAVTYGSRSNQVEFDPLFLQKSHAVNGQTENESLPPIPVAHEAPHADKPPSVYGMGNQEVSRPDTPNSQISRRSGPSVTEIQQQENIATIQPTIHQQMNAGQMQPVFEGTPPMFGTTTSVPSPMPSVQQPTLPVVVAPPLPQQMFSLPQGHAPVPAPPVSSVAPPVTQFGHHPPPPSAMNQLQGPPPPMSVPAPQSMAPMMSYTAPTPSNPMGQPQYIPHPAPPQASAMSISGATMPPSGPPQISSFVPGVNPFVRGPNPATNPYVRQPFPAYQQQ